MPSPECAGTCTQPKQGAHTPEACHNIAACCRLGRSGSSSDTPTPPRCLLRAIWRAQARNPLVLRTGVKGAAEKALTCCSEGSNISLAAAMRAALYLHHTSGRAARSRSSMRPTVRLGLEAGGDLKALRKLTLNLRILPKKNTVEKQKLWNLAN